MSTKTKIENNLQENEFLCLPLKTFIKITFKAMVVKTLAKILKRDEGSKHTKKKNTKNLEKGKKLY